MRSLLFPAFFWGLFLAATAHATSDVSARFDGRYDGMANPVAWMSKPGCVAFEVRGLEILKGTVKYGNEYEAPRIRGFITAEGYLKSTLAPLGGSAVALEGRLEEGRLVAGAIDNTAGCVWILELVPAAVK